MRVASRREGDPPHADRCHHPSSRHVRDAARRARRRAPALAPHRGPRWPRLMRILEVVGLTKRFAGLTALDAVSFTAEEGQVLGLFGPSGAGKTTCFHCLSGFMAPDSGRIIFDGREITGQPPHRLARAGLARTFQIAVPFKTLTAAENVAVALAPRRPGAGRRARRVARPDDARPRAGAPRARWPRRPGRPPRRPAAARHAEAPGGGPRPRPRSPARPA